MLSTQLRRGLFAAGLGLFVACIPSAEDPPKDGGTGGGTGAGTPTYKKDIQPIFQAKCADATCHGGASAGFHNIATTYADVKKTAMSMSADGCFEPVEGQDPVFVTVGECALISAKRGWMPAFKGCDMATPPNPSVCVSAAEISLLEKWVKAGMPES